MYSTMRNVRERIMPKPEGRDPQKSRYLVESVLRAVFSTTTFPSAAPIWMVNPSFEVGTSLFDQFRRVPRPHVFDLNAASLVDLLAIPSIDPPLARAILDGAPYASVDALQHAAGVTPDLVARFREMAAPQARARAADAEHGAVASLRAILMAYVWQAAAILLVAAAGGALLFRRVTASSWRRAVPSGFTAGFLGLVAAWLGNAPALLLALGVPVLVGGAPAALWSLARRRPPPQALRVLVGWAAAGVPTAVLVQPWF
jgi:hypothetical protein